MGAASNGEIDRVVMNMIEECFSGTQSIHEIISRLAVHRSASAAAALKSINQVCPVSVKVLCRDHLYSLAYPEQVGLDNLERCRQGTLEESYRREFRIGVRMWKRSDAGEGIEHVLSKKAGGVQWDISSVDAVSDRNVAEVRAPFTREEGISELELPRDPERDPEKERAKL